ncbi:Mu transposase C-terminal domain-containing protein [Streptomyces sp. NPDC058439]|uniref:Mu transposase C-terminal domain-containing protein n=1 Tax=Streptomyces sp. NPDC058439 TaxID=3346500 RepID=UPI00364D60C0
MSFKAFTEELLTWAHWWNTEHRPTELHGATPLEAWQADPTPLNDIPAADVWSLTLEDDERTRTITSHGVRFKNRDYIAAWMTGQAGRKVMVRFMPHHNHEIELCTPCGRHLGTAYLADQAAPEQLDALRRTRTERARRLRAEAKAAEQLRHTRFARHRAGPPAPPGHPDHPPRRVRTRPASAHRPGSPGAARPDPTRPTTGRLGHARGPQGPHPTHRTNPQRGNPMTGGHLPPAPTDQYTALPDARLVVGVVERGHAPAAGDGPLR